VKTLGVLWDEAVSPGSRGFSNEKVKSPYKYLGDSADFQVVMGNYQDLDSDRLTNGLVYNDGWRHVEHISLDGVYDKFEWNEKTAELKRSLDSRLTVVNPFEVEKVCKDKLQTYRRFPGLVPETQETSNEAVKQFIREYGKAVVKPRFDYGGREVQVLEEIDGFEGREDMIVQRFVDLSKGVPGITDGVHDLRALIANGEPIAFLLRTPESGLISNVGRGGSLEKVEEELVPDEVFEILEEVDLSLRSHGDRFYTVDLGFDGDRFHVLERVDTLVD